MRSIHFFRTWFRPQTALAAPLPVFCPRARPCSLNHGRGYAFGREHAHAGKIRGDYRGPWCNMRASAPVVATVVDVSAFQHSYTMELNGKIRCLFERGPVRGRERCPQGTGARSVRSNLGRQGHVRDATEFRQRCPGTRTASPVPEGGVLEYGCAKRMRGLPGMRTGAQRPSDNGVGPGLKAGFEPLSGVAAWCAGGRRVGCRCPGPGPGVAGRCGLCRCIGRDRSDRFPGGRLIGEASGLRNIECIV